MMNASSLSATLKKTLVSMIKPFKFKQECVLTDNNVEITKDNKDEEDQTEESSQSCRSTLV